MPEQLAEQFQDMAKQAHAARLGMWVFIGSEALFFSGLFTLYASYRIEHPVGFGLGVLDNTTDWGSTNTFILLGSSYVLTLSVRALRRSQPRLSAVWLALTILLGTAFAWIKIGEWFHHFYVDHLFPGGQGSFFDEHSDPGEKMFFTLYFAITGLHEIHILVGLGILGFLLWKVLRREIGPWAPHPLEIGSIYWHFVDIIWIFVWPSFYLVTGAVK
jgi:cytochrome c oxidase subunit 3